MTATVFVDTNVLVYARDASDAGRHERALEWMAELWGSRAGRLSYQVLQEYYVTVTRKLDPPRSIDDARADLASLVAWRPAAAGLETLDRAWDVQDRYGFSWWDALIVAAAQLSDCTHLLTEDLQDGQRLGDLLVIDPFTHSPSDILGPDRG